MTFSTFLANFSPSFVAICAALFLTACVYAVLVYYASRRGWLEGYTWLSVVVGNMLVLIAAYVQLAAADLDPFPIVLVFIFFGVAGLPMAAGDILKHIQAKERLTVFMTRFRGANEQEKGKGMGAG